MRNNQRSFSHSSNNRRYNSGRRAYHAYGRGRRRQATFDPTQVVLKAEQEKSQTVIEEELENDN